MKKAILCIGLVLSTLTVGGYAKGSHSAQQGTSVTVVSDTTGTDDAGEDETDYATDPSSINAQMDSAIQQAFGTDNTDNQDEGSKSSGKGFSWTDSGDKFVLTALLIIFGFPVLLVALILYFVYRNKKAKYELDKAAIEKGIYTNARYYTGAYAQPTDSSEGTANTGGKKGVFLNPNTKLWEKGVKEMCLGVGLALLLGFLCDASLSLIGVLVFFIGLGKVIIAQSRKAHESDPSYYYDPNRPFHTQEKPDSSAGDEYKTKEEAD